MQNLRPPANSEKPWHRVKWADDAEAPHCIPDSPGAKLWPRLRGRAIAVRHWGTREEFAATYGAANMPPECECEQFFQFLAAEDIDRDIAAVNSAPIACSRVFEMD